MTDVPGLAAVSGVEDRLEIAHRPAALR
jgi:hypothetical protein